MFNALRPSSRLLRIGATPRLSAPLQIRCLSLTPRLERLGDHLTQNRRRPPPSSMRTRSPTKDTTDRSDHSAIAIDKEHEVDVDTPDQFTLFQDLADQKMIDPRIIKTITEGMKYSEMTKVQRKTIASTLAGNDVLAQARTGTGKTIAFLLPALQRLITNPIPLRQGAKDIRCVIISPTRELAMQIHKDALKLTRGTPIIPQVAVGGTGRSQSLYQMSREGCHLLIATPGRLNDLLSDPSAGIDTRNVDTLVLDEGDTLLDQGFHIAIQEIVSKLPPSNSSVRKGEGRQSLIFSATMPAKVLDMVRNTLKPNYQFLKMVSANEKPVHERVTQHVVPVKGFENLLPSVVELAQREALAHETFKAIVFLPTTKFTALAAATFRHATSRESNTHTVEIHSRLTQGARTRAAENFRRARKAVMFASDVVARGMDFPNVTHVIQISLPSSKEQYIHRLGRTARGDKNGIGYLLVTESEARDKAFHALTHGLGLLADSHNLHIPSVVMDQEQTLPKSAADALTRTMEASLAIEPDLKRATYLSCMGYFNGVINKQVLITGLNKWAQLGWGMPTPPPIDRNLVSKLGFSNIVGVNIGSREASAGRGGFGGETRNFSGGDRRGGFGSERSGGFGGERGGGYSGGSRSGGFGSGDRGGFGGGDRRGSGGFGGGDRRGSGGFGGGDRRGSGGFGGGDRRGSGGFGGGDRRGSGGFGGSDRRGSGGFGGGDRGGYNGRGGDRRPPPRRDDRSFDFE